MSRSLLEGRLCWCVMWANFLKSLIGIFKVEPPPPSLPPRVQLKCRRGSGTMRATLCTCRWLRVKRAPSAAPWARRPPRTAAGPTSTSPSTRMCSFISRTIRVRDPPGFTCWRDARVSAHRRPKSPPPARSQWRSSRWVLASAAAAVVVVV